MLSTLVFLKFFGLVFTVMGLAFLTNKTLLTSVVNSLTQHKAIAFIFGLLPLALGSYLISVHNICGNTKQCIVTALAWLFFVGGTFRVLFFNYWLDIVNKCKDSLPTFLVGAIQLALGLVFLYLSCNG